MKEFRNTEECAQTNLVTSETMKHLYSKLDTILWSRGPDELINYIKLIRQAHMNFLSEDMKPLRGIGLTYDGIPKVFKELVPIMRNLKNDKWSEDKLQILPFLNTLLWSTRSLKTGRKPDLGPITHPFTGTLRVFSKRSVNSFWNAIGIKSRELNRVPKRYRWKDFRLTTKGGPNGQALACSVIDLYQLPDELLASIKYLAPPKLTEIIEVLTDPEIKNNLLEIYNQVGLSGDKFRRITYFPDMEKKVRVIAILDYFSQEVLYQLHLFLFNILKNNIKCDCTFSQGSSEHLLKGADIYYSIDLSNATDRFPISAISSVLSGIFSSDFVNHWENIMVGFPFDVDNSTSKVSYEVGNPMGAYSSWASFAIAHHYVVFLACERVKFPFKKLKYALLGDDIVISNKEVAEEYIQIIKALGVEISELKTHKSDKFYEFAKRLFYRNKEITPFPISALKESKKRYYLLVSLLLQENRKGWVGKDGIPLAIESFHTHVLPIRRKLRRKLVMWSHATELMINYISQDISASEVVNNLGRLYVPEWVPKTEEDCIDIIFRCFETQFFASAKKFLFSPEPLGNMSQMATDRIMDLFCENDHIARKYPNLNIDDVIPVNNVIRKSITQCSRLSSRMMSLNPKTPEQWLTIRAITVPCKDEVFVMKSKDLKSLAAAKVGRNLISFLTSPPRDEEEKEEKPINALLSSLFGGKLPPGLF